MNDSNTAGETERRRDALDHVSDGVIALDFERRYTYLNRSVGTSVDTDPESLPGEHVRVGFPDMQGIAVQEAVERALQAGRVTSFEQYNRPGAGGGWRAPFRSTIPVSR